MKGMNLRTGQWLGGIDHLQQSIRDILTTPIGSRVMRRDYGSRLPDLVDAPINRATIVEIYTATAEALLMWEPRLKLSRVQVEEAEPGLIRLRLEGLYQPSGETTTLEGIEL